MSNSTLTASASSAVAWTQHVDDAPVAITTRADLIAVAGAGGTAWILDARDGSPIATVTLPGGLLAADFSPDGAHLALAGPAGHALWRREDGRILIFETGTWSNAVRWSSTREAAATAGHPPRLAIASGRRASVVDADGTLQWQTDPCPSTVTDLSWLRAGRRLAVAAYGGVYCHERHTGAPVAEYRYLGSHLRIVADPAEKWLCSGNQDASIHIWRIRDGADLAMSGYPDKIARLAFEDTGRYLASDGAPDITVWDFAGKGPEGTRPRMLRAHETVTALAWRPGNEAILASGGAEGLLAVWRAASGRPGARHRPVLEYEHDQPITAAAWSGPDLLVSTDRTGTIHARTYPVR
jgi:WD40 repeat protein